MIAAVIKIGGSLAKTPPLPDVCNALGELGREHPLLVVPGGGLFADAVRTCHERFPISQSAAHWMAILGMDQYGLLLTDLTAGSKTVVSPDQAQSVAKQGLVPILLSSEWLRRSDALPHSWDVTSDSIAVWIAAAIKAPRCVLVKESDGLYTSYPPADAKALPCARMSVAELKTCRGVDRYLPQLLTANAPELWVVNGHHPERLEELLTTGTTLGTRIIA